MLWLVEQQLELGMSLWLHCKKELKQKVSNNDIYVNFYIEVSLQG